MADRDELARIPPAPGPERTKARRAADRVLARRPGTQPQPWRDEGLALWDRLLTTAERDLRARPTPVELGRLQAALTDPWVRDAVVLSLADAPEGTSVDLAVIFEPGRGRPPVGDRADAAVRVLTQVVAHSQESRCAPALTVLALLAWWRGDGARSRVLVDRAFAADPDHRLAVLLRDALVAGLGPGWTRPAPAARGRRTG